jgi:hypothetical protein
LIAVRAYLRNLQNKPDTAVNLLLRSIGRFSTPDADDLKMWDCVMQTVKPDNVTTVLQKAQDERLKLSNVGQGSFFFSFTARFHILHAHQPLLLISPAMRHRTWNPARKIVPQLSWVGFLRFHFMTPTFVK